MGILDKLMAERAAEQPTEPSTPVQSDDSAFTKGLRSGMTSLGGQTHALLGQAGELVGADNFAAEQRAASQAAQEQAAQERAGMVESYKGVHDLRSAWDYGTGLVGSSVPAMVAGVAGAKLMPGKGALPAITGATLATAPSTIGAQFEAQQANPELAKAGVVDRTLTGLAAGGLQAAAMNIVPQIVGGKLFGKVAEGAERAAMPFGKAVMNNVPEAVLGNAAAGVASPLIGQVAASHLNPERDRSQDNTEMAEGAVSGAAMGLPFAALGIAGDMRGAKAPKPSEPLVRSTETERAEGVPLPSAAKAPSTFTEKVADLGTPLRVEPVTNEEHAAPAVQGDTPEIMAAKDTAGATAAADKARRTMDKLLADQQALGLHEELGTLDPTTSAGQARIGELNVQHFDAKQRAKAVDEANTAAAKDAEDVGGSASFSKDTSGVDAQIHKVLDKTRDWEYQDDEQRAAAASVLRRVIENGENTGRVSALDRNAVSLLLGKNPVGSLSEMYDAIGSKDPAKADKFYSALAQMGETQKVNDALLSTVRNALPENMTGKVRMSQLKDFVAQMKDVTDESAFKDMTASEQSVKKQQVAARLTEIFGDNADKVNEAFAKHAKDEAALSVPDRTAALGAETDLGDAPHEAPPTYYGKKGDNPFLLNNEAHAREFPDTPDAARPQSQRLETALKNSEHGTVEWQSAREHAREVGMSKEELMRLTGDKPDDFGVVRAMPKSDDTFALKPADVDAMKLGVHTTGIDPVSGETVNKRTAPKKSWIDGPSTITLGGVKADLSDDIHFDATRIASWMARQDGKNADRSVVAGERSDLYRTAQAFTEGIAALTDHYGRKIPVKDETVVVKGFGEKPDVTWGELQQVLKDGDMGDQARAQLKPLREQRDTLLAEREAGRLKTQNENGALDEQALKTAMDQSDAKFNDRIKITTDKIEKVAAAEEAKRAKTFDASEHSTNDLKKLVSDYTIRLDNAETEVARLSALDEKKGLTAWQKDQLERQQRTVEKLSALVPNLEEAIAKRADRATFAEAKELGNDYGTGRDSGGGIDVRREQLRAAEQAAGKYDALLGKLDKNKPGSPAEAKAWRDANEQAKAQLRTSLGKAPDETSSEYRRLARFQKLIEAKDRAGIEKLRDNAKAAAEVTGKEFGMGDNGKPFVRPEKGLRDETSLGVSEIDPAAEVHLAAAEFGDELGAVSARSRQVAGEFVQPARAKDATRGPVENWAELNRRADGLMAAKSGSMQRLGTMLRGLLDNQDVLTPTHRGELAKLLEKRTALSMAPSVKSLYDQYHNTENWSDTGHRSIAKIASEAGPQHDAAMRQVARSNDAKALQSSVLTLLADKKPNAAKQELIAHMNDRISAIVEKDPSRAYGLKVRGNEPPANFMESMDSRVKTDPNATPANAAETAKLVDHINKVTGNSVDVNAAAKMLYAGSYLEARTDAAGIDHRPAINVSVHALDPTSVGYHESLHWLADHLRKNGDPKVFDALVETANSPYVRNVLRTVFKDQPEVLKQVMDSAEERVAYMYQLYANGNLKLGDRGKTILDKIGDYIRKVMGVWTNDQRAEHIMKYFNSGDYGAATSMGAKVHERDPIYKYLMEQGRNHTLDYLGKTAKPLNDLVSSVGGIGSARLRDMGIPAITKIADMIRLHGTQEGTDAGYLPAAGTEFRSWSNKLVERMGEFTFDEANEAFAATALGKMPKDAKQTKLMNAIDSIMTDMHAYMREAGVDIGDRKNAQGKYTPRQWDPAYVAGHQTEFREMIQKYIDNGQFKGTADDLMSRLLRDEGSEIESADFLARPGDQYAKKRELHFITAADAAPFLEQNAMRVLTSYIKQGTRRAEWARRFEAMTPQEQTAYDAMGYAEKRAYDAERATPMDKLRAAAVKQGATPEQMALVDKYLEGVTGQLGADVHPGTRKLFGQIMVYENLRLLPMGFFSSLIDPMGVAVRGGDMHDVFNNFKRGIMEIPRGFKKNPKYDAGYHLAEDMGIIDNAVLQHVLGASYGLNAVGNKARAINETLFKYNLMEQMNTSQRVAATEASMRFLLKHKDGDATPHSARYLNELGLKPADIKTIGTGKDAHVAVRIADFQQLGMNEKAATAAHLKMRQAINSWVDGAVLRPDQSQKAIWMNDAHFSLIAHMKQFAFAFQDTILKRALNEAKYGNYQPAYALAGYIPVMLAADLMKGMIQGGGSQPDWKQDWTLGDYVGSAWQRSGLNGVGQFPMDAFKDLHHGGVGIGALGGPSLGQLSDVVSTVGGNRGVEHTLIDSMPANALWSGYLPNSISHPEAAGGTGRAAPTELNTVD